MISLSTADGDVLEAIGGLRAIASQGDAASIPSAVGMVVVQARLREQAAVIGEERHLLAALVVLGESWLAQHRDTGRAGVHAFARTCRAFESLGSADRGSYPAVPLARC